MHCQTRAVIAWLPGAAGSIATFVTQSLFAAKAPSGAAALTVTLFLLLRERGCVSLQISPGLYRSG